MSLLPSATEIVCALGFGDALVGRSHECDFPATVRNLPVCSRPRLDPSASGLAIDAQVRTLLEQGLSVFEVDAKRLAELKPDIIVTQTQCEVCAVTPADIESALHEFTGDQPRIVSLEPNTLGDVWADVERTGVALDAPHAGAALRASLETQMQSLATKAQAFPYRPGVACIEWITPLMAAGNWIPELVELANGHNLFGDSGAHSPWLEWAQLRQADPDVMILMPCGFDLERTLAEAKHLGSLEGWSALRAVANNRVIAVDGHQYFNRPGPRLVESLAMLIDALHQPAGQLSKMHPSAVAVLAPSAV